MTPEEIVKLVRESAGSITKDVIAGVMKELGVSPKTLGALGNCGPAPCGCSGGGLNPESSVEAFITAGSPILALARAKKCPFVPWDLRITSEFPDTTVQTLPDNDLDERIPNDVIVKSVVFSLLNEETANATQLSSISDYFFNQQSGIECRMIVTGRPGYPTDASFIPIELKSDRQSSSDWPSGWLLTFTQGVTSSFRSTIVLPFAPIRVSQVFHIWTPLGEEWTNMKPAEAARELREKFGIECPEPYPCR